MKFKLLALLILAAFVLSIQINKPFYGYHDWNGLTYGQIARNYVHYGLLNTRLGQVENFTSTTSENFRYDTHYPPLFTLLLSLPVFIFGSYEWAIRLLPLLLSLTNLFLIYYLGKLLVSPKVGFLASIIAFLTPIFFYFGKNPVHEVLNLTFLLLNTILFCLALNSKKKEKYFRLLLSSCFISLFSGWPVYYSLPLIALFGFKKTSDKRYLLFFLLPFIGLGLHLLHIRLLTGSFTGGGLIEIVLYRLSLTTENTKDAFTLTQFISRFLLFSRNMFTVPILISAFFGLYFAKKYWVYFAILFTGILHPIVFSNIGYIHDYLQLPLLAFIALSSAILFHQLSPKKILIIGTAFALMSLWSKWSFTNAMINSYMSKPEYDLVMTKIKPLMTNESLTLPYNDAKLLTGVVTPYYLQTEVEYTEGDAEEFEVIRLEDKLIIKPYE